MNIMKEIANYYDIPLDELLADIPAKYSVIRHMNDLGMLPKDRPAPLIDPVKCHRELKQ